MTTILQITSSPRGADSRSSQLARELTAGLLERDPSARVVARDLAASPVPVVDGELLGALVAAEKSSEQVQLMAAHDALIAEIQAADVIVFGVPMYNFMVPVQLKSYFDAIVRAGVTFRYGANGPEGLLRGKKVYVVFARGGRHRGTASDVQTPFVKQLLGFVGLTDVAYVFAEGLDMGPEAQVRGLAEARAAIAELTRASFAAARAA